MFGKAIGDVVAVQGRSADAIRWYRYVYDQGRDAPGRYGALRTAIDLLMVAQDPRTAAQWAAELFAETEHPEDGRRWATALSAMGETNLAASVLRRVAMVEAARQRELNEDAARRARRMQ
jgi:hypothetical protein